MSKLDLLRNVSLFTGLSDQELQTLAESLHRRAFGKGTIVFDQGSTDATLYVIESGRVRIFLISEFGEEISLQVYDPGQCFGEFAVLDGQPRSAGAVAMEDIVTYTLHRGDFLRHLETCPHMAIRIIQVLTTRLRYTTRQMENLAFLDVSGRVAAKLLELADRYGVQKEGIEITLPLTQEELATWVVVTRKSVSSVLTHFRDLGLIQVQRRRITILDPKALKKKIIY